jgi:hypothetical protein
MHATSVGMSTGFEDAVKQKALHLIECEQFFEDKRPRIEREQLIVSTGIAGVDWKEKLVNGNLQRRREI